MNLLFWILEIESLKVGLVVCEVLVLTQDDVCDSDESYSLTCNVRDHHAIALRRPVEMRDLHILHHAVHQVARLARALSCALLEDGIVWHLITVSYRRIRLIIYVEEVVSEWNVSEPSFLVLEVDFLFDDRVADRSVLLLPKTSLLSVRKHGLKFLALVILCRILCISRHKLAAEADFWSFSSDILAINIWISRQIMLLIDFYCIIAIIDDHH